MSTSANLGYPRYGRQRELKFALEKYWTGKISAEVLDNVAAQLKLTHWSIQKENGIEIIPSNDFSLYDQVLDTTWMIGAIPQRFEGLMGKKPDLDVYFAMSRGWQDNTKQLPAMEMTKWFDTNYHYIVPEILPNQRFFLHDQKPIREYIEAKKAGFQTRPVLLGPLSYLLLSKSPNPSYNPLQALPNLLPVYYEILNLLAEAGADWVQIDEPCLVLDLDPSIQKAFFEAYTRLHEVHALHIMLTTYFGGLEDNLAWVVKLPIAGLHVDLVRSPEQIEAVLSMLPASIVLSLGLVDGRNVWRTDLEAALRIARQAAQQRGSDGLQIAPSCSLLFCPYDLDIENTLDPEIKSWLSFARQKLIEVSLLNTAIQGDVELVDIVKQNLTNNQKILQDRLVSSKVINTQTQERLSEIDESFFNRQSVFAQRKHLQANILSLPILPTTTIGSYPQTSEIRKQRFLFNRGEVSWKDYDLFLKKEIENVIRVQEDLGLDILVHGEPERTDMVEYFAEQMDGFALTQHGWVQSYGSRAVRPPIIYGDISRYAPMTVACAQYAQSLTQKPIKGMLTGPITILQWSFVRNDQPRELTCKQIALALRDEVQDLEAGGINIIQIDEPALREGLPLRKAQREAYLNWAVQCFRLVSGVVSDQTQIHTHMCYAEFSEIITAITQMDADVISIEASRSNMELLDAFRQHQYPNDIGPGIYDIHSPRIPTIEEFVTLIHKALQVIPAERLWINPDCGLKTRKWDEVLPSLANLVEATRQVRRTIVK